MARTIKLISIFFIFTICNAFQNQPKEVDKIIYFLNNFNTLSSEFVQINSVGEVIHGKILVNKPSKFRIEYKDPNDILIICDGFKVAIINNKLKSFSTYSITDTPLNFFLKEKITSESFEIINFQKKENLFIIEIMSKVDKDSGNIKLIFEENPFQLKKWILYNPNGDKISVTLDNLRINPKIKDQLFEVKDPNNKILLENF
ncbi:MAG: hypothetical protein CMP33_03860 [Rickettsiales bacterium]|nr:hypothetical protein [Rickettsiales bacterium]